MPRTPHSSAEIYHPAAPATGTWAMAATARVARLYHSVALLMPDGKVITAGSNPARQTEELRIEVFWPPYLFAGPRPTCTPAATKVTYGNSLAAAVPDAGQIASACLMRPGATTHSLDAEQRLVDLPLQVTAADALELQLPATRRSLRPAGTCSSWSTPPACHPRAVGSTSPELCSTYYPYASGS